MENELDISEFDYRDALLKAAKKYCRDARIELATLGNKAAQDNRFFKNIKDGKTCTMDKLQYVLRWMIDNPPNITPTSQKVKKHKRSHTISTDSVNNNL